MPLSSLSTSGSYKPTSGTSKPTKLSKNVPTTTLEPPKRPTAKLIPKTTAQGNPPDSGVQSSPKGGPQAKLFDPPGQTKVTAQADGKMTQGKFANKTSLLPESQRNTVVGNSGGQGNARKTQLDPSLPSPSAAGNTQAGQGDSGGSAFPSMPTNAEQPSTMAPWDRPPLGSIPTNQWGADEHFISNL